MATLTLTAAANAAAQYLGVLDSGESLSTQQVADALAAANWLLDNLSSDETMILQSVRTVQTLTAGVQVYTIGTGQTWNMTRPVAIAAATLLNASGPGVPMTVLDEKAWTQFPDRQSQSYAVRGIFYDRGNPTGNCYVTPVPLGSGLSVELITWSPLAPFADATTPRTMEPGYARMLEMALAIEIAPQYDVKPSDTLMANYQNAMNTVRALNASRIAGPQVAA